MKLNEIKEASSKVVFRKSIHHIEERNTNEGKFFDVKSKGANDQIYHRKTFRDLPAAKTYLNGLEKK